jgi:copper homeostasis protein
MPTSVSPQRITLEVCVTTADEAVSAVAAGANRLELCAALEVGGVTPSPATFLEVRSVVTVPVCVLLRPRPGGFAYSPREWATVRRDADWFLAHGADAIVGGALDESGDLHRDRCRDLVRAAGGRAVLHRAFDFLPDLALGLSAAIDLGFARVLTSGGAVTAPTGAGAIRGLWRQAAGRVELLPGGGISDANVAGLLAATGCDQVHGSFRSTLPTSSHPLTGQMGVRTATDPLKVAAVRSVLDRVATG